MILRIFFFLHVLAFLNIRFSYSQCDNLLPMYGEHCIKTDENKRIDSTYIKNMLNLHKTADSACKISIRNAASYFYHKDDSTAMKRLNQAWLLTPNQPYIYFWFGYLIEFSFQKDPLLASKYYRMARDKGANKFEEATSLATLIDCLEARRDTAAIIRASTFLINVSEEYEKGYGYKKRSYYYLQQKKYKETIYDCDKALIIDPEDDNSFVGRGYANSQLGNFDEALKDFNKAVSLSKGWGRKGTDITSALGNRANFYAYSMNNLELAIKDMDMIIAITNSPFDYKYKGDIYFKFNKDSEGCECYKKAIKLGGKELKSLYKEKCK